MTVERLFYSRQIVSNKTTHRILSLWSRDPLNLLPVLVQMGVDKQ